MHIFIVCYYDRDYYAVYVHGELQIASITGPDPEIFKRGGCWNYKTSRDYIEWVLLGIKIAT